MNVVTAGRDGLEPLLSAVAAEGRTVRIPDLADTPLGGQAPRWASTHASVVGVTLRAGTEALGAVCAARWNGPAPFNDEQTWLLELLGAYAARIVGLSRQLDAGSARSRFFEGLVEQTPDPMLFFERPRVVAYANPAARRQLLASTGVAYGVGPVPGFLSDDGQPLAADDQPDARLFHGERVEDERFLTRGADGRVIPFRVNAGPLRDQSGRIVGVVSTFRDVLAEEELERLRSELAAMVVHDLRNPLGAMVLSAEGLLQGAHDGEVRAPAIVLERILHAGRRLARQINDLLDATRIGLGQLGLQLIETDLVQVVAETAEELRPAMGDHRLEVQTGSGPARIMMDPVRLTQILTNLLTNAAKYSRPGGRVRVRAQAEGDGVVLSVQDEGPGIPAEDIPRLFDRFFQARRRHSRHSEGLGLGLYITKGFVDASGGRITVESEPGLGSRFTIRWPTAGRQPQTAVAPPAG